MSATPRTNRNARIATALFLVALTYAAPTVAAEDNLPEQRDDGSIAAGDCLLINPHTVPPSISINPYNCIPPYIPPIPPI